jgi:hypothetical protein
LHGLAPVRKGVERLHGIPPSALSGRNELRTNVPTTRRERVYIR